MAAHKSQQWRELTSGKLFWEVILIIAHHNTGDVKFVEDAILELQRSRHALMSSYVHAYYIKRHMEREEFEKLQVGMVTLPTNCFTSNNRAALRLQLNYWQKLLLGLTLKHLA